jgi:catechol 2,3-dioxygenase-like lactoylglutathione lyase family enzyme
VPSFLNARPNFLVRDVTRTAEWYRDLLGFQIVATMGEPKPYFGLVVREGAEIALVQDDTPQVNGCYVYVTGVDELYEQLKAAGADFDGETTTQPWGNRDFVIRDPDGHHIAIGERLSHAQ